jgi:hypothetical protein
MADTRGIEVNLVVTEKIDDGSDKPKPKTPKRKTAKSDNTNIEATTSVLLHEAYNYAKQTITEIASYEVNKYFNLSDDYQTQRNVTIAKNVISKATGMGTAIASGFKMGGAVGGAIAIVGSVASLGVEIAQNYDQERIKLNQANAQLSYSRLRAGYSLVSDSVGENL